MIDELTVLKAEHDLITAVYEYLDGENDKDIGERIQYILGVHDLAVMLLKGMNTESEG